MYCLQVDLQHLHVQYTPRVTNTRGWLREVGSSNPPTHPVHTVCIGYHDLKKNQLIDLTALRLLFATQLLIFILADPGYFQIKPRRKPSLLHLGHLS